MPVIYNRDVWDRIRARGRATTGDDVALLLCGDSNFTFPNPNGRYGWYTGLMNALTSAGWSMSGAYFPPSAPGIDLGGGFGAVSQAGFEDFDYDETKFNVTYAITSAGSTGGGESISGVQDNLDRDANTVAGDAVTYDLLTFTDQYFTGTFGKNDGTLPNLYPGHPLYDASTTAATSPVNLTVEWLIHMTGTPSFAPRVRDYNFDTTTAGSGTTITPSANTATGFQTVAEDCDLSDYDEGIFVEWGTAAANCTGPAAMYGVMIRKTTLAGGFRLCPLHFVGGSHTDHMNRAFQRVNNGFYGWYPDAMTSGQSSKMAALVISLGTNDVFFDLTRTQYRANLQEAIETFRTRTLANSSNFTSNYQLPVVLITPHPRAAGETAYLADFLKTVGDDMRTVADAVGNACVIDLHESYNDAPLTSSLYASGSTTHLTTTGYDTIMERVIEDMEFKRANFQATATATARTLTVNTTYAKEVYVQNTGSVDLLVNVPRVHGSGDFDTVEPGDTATYSSTGDIGSIIVKTGSGQTTYNAGVTSGSA